MAEKVKEEKAGEVLSSAEGKKPVKKAEDTISAPLPRCQSSSEQKTENQQAETKAETKNPASSSQEEAEHTLPAAEQSCEQKPEEPDQSLGEQEEDEEAESTTDAKMAMWMAVLNASSNSQASKFWAPAPGRAARTRRRC